MKAKSLLLFLIVLGISLPLFSSAISEGQIDSFYLDKSYDLNERDKVSAILKKISDKAYFYLEKEWYEELEEEKKEEIEEILNILAEEFDENIYPKTINFYGQEWNPGIDNEERIFILFHQMKKGMGGYFNNGNEYEVIQNPKSNEKEMIYLNANNVFYEIIKPYIAHEFVHLINFNQKERLRGIKEEVWLNEMRADYITTYLGYNEEYQGSNLRQRVKNFLKDSSNSLIKWENQKEDYGIINMVSHYLVDYLGEKILSDSMKNSLTGIASLDEALDNLSYEKDFQDIFSLWSVAVLLNDCTFGENYCYKNENLANLRVIPTLAFIPTSRKSSTLLHYSVEPWSGNWYRIIGGEGDLELSFEGEEEGNFNVSYVVCRNGSKCQVDFLELNQGKGEVLLENFGEKWGSLTLIPLAQPENFDKENFKFSLGISFKESREKIIEELKAQIVELKEKIALLKTKIAAILKEKDYCSFNNNLYLGMEGLEVKCLQNFLKSQGEEIYPEGIVSGWFGPLTYEAVIRFQERYNREVLSPLGLEKGTGFVGKMTREKIIQLID